MAHRECKKRVRPLLACLKAGFRLSDCKQEIGGYRVAVVSYVGINLRISSSGVWLRDGSGLHSPSLRPGRIEFARRPFGRKKFDCDSISISRSPK